MKQTNTVENKNLSLEETLFIFRRTLDDILRKEAEDLHFPISQIETLSFIAGKGNPSMKEIATHLKITPPSATTIIELMQKKKLITRVTNNNDRRTVRVTLTPFAWTFFKTLHERKIMIFNKMLSKLKNSEKEQLIKILNILIAE